MSTALFRYFCEGKPLDTSSEDEEDTTEEYDDTATASTSDSSTSASDDCQRSIICEMTAEKSPTQGPQCSQNTARSQLMALLFDIYCLLNGFFRSLLDSNCRIRVKCKGKEAADDMAILDILQRIVDREILVDEKCQKYPALIPMLTTINRKFQYAEELFSDAVEANNSDLMETIVESVENIQDYFECLQVLNNTEKEVESDLQEILFYLDYPLQPGNTTMIRKKC